MGLRVIAIDTGSDKKNLCEKLGASAWVDFKESSNIVNDVLAATGGKGANAALMTSASVGCSNYELIRCFIPFRPPHTSRHLSTLHQRGRL